MNNICKNFKNYRFSSQDTLLNMPKNNHSIISDKLKIIDFNFLQKYFMNIELAMLFIDTSPYPQYFDKIVCEYGIYEITSKINPIYEATCPYFNKYILNDFSTNKSHLKKIFFIPIFSDEIDFFIIRLNQYKKINAYSSYQNTFKNIKLKKIINKIGSDKIDILNSYIFLDRV